MPHTSRNDPGFFHVFEPGSDPTAPPLLLLHGTGGTEHDLLRLGRAISPGSALLSPRGQVNEGGALRFFARLAAGVFDPAEVARRTHQLADFIAGVVTNWDAATVTDKIELRVGRDLQYVRINGTLVGFMAGGVLFAVLTALFGRVSH
jgi:hypothetical protein